MKYYTYEEHHVFCIESGIYNSTIWYEVVKLGWLPEGIYHEPAVAFNPKQKAKQKEYDKKRQSTLEHKAKRKEYDKKRQSTLEHKAKRKEWNKRHYLKNKK